MVLKSNSPEEFTAKSKFGKFSPNLDLYNFESNDALYSSYILTSPRSLKACQLADIKPIELLHRSIEEIAAELNLETSQVDHIHFNYEQERLKKLEICKMIRKHILTSELLETSELASPTRFSPTDHLSRFTQPKRDCTPDLLPPRPTYEGTQSVNSYSVPTTPLTHYNSMNNSMLSSSNDSVNYNYQKRSKSVEDKKYKHHTDEKSQPKKSTFSSRKTKNEKKNQNKFSHKATTPINDRELCWEIDKTKKAENDVINKKIQAKDRRKKLKEKKKSIEKQETVEKNFTESCENLLQTSSKVAKRQASDSRSKISAKKRNPESQNDVKQIPKKNMAKNSGPHCEEILKNANKVDFDLSNVNTMAIKSHDARILDAMISKKEKQENQDNFASKANMVWGMAEEEMPNKSYFHHSGSKNLKSDICACSENFAMENYFQQIKDKIKQLKENCLYKELHSEHVRQLARELQIGMEQWQDQVLLLQWKALQRAQTNAKLLLENKRLKTQSENKERTLMHALRFRNVQQLERIKQQIMKKEIEEKDNRIERLKIKREQEITNCRAQAHYTAELREQLRDTLTPETFDKKVNDVLVKSKFINRLLSTNSFGESKIRLG